MRKTCKKHNEELFEAWEGIEICDSCFVEQQLIEKEIEQEKEYLDSVSYENADFLKVISKETLYG